MGGGNGGGADPSSAVEKEHQIVVYRSNNLDQPFVLVHNVQPLQSFDPSAAGALSGDVPQGALISGVDSSSDAESGEGGGSTFGSPRFAESDTCDGEDGWGDSDHQSDGGDCEGDSDHPGDEEGSGGDCDDHQGNGGACDCQSNALMRQVSASVLLNHQPREERQAGEPSFTRGRARSLEVRHAQARRGRAIRLGRRPISDDPRFFRLRTEAARRRFYEAGPNAGLQMRRSMYPTILSRRRRLLQSPVATMLLMLYLTRGARYA